MFPSFLSILITYELFFYSHGRSVVVDSVVVVVVGVVVVVVVVGVVVVVVGVVDVVVDVVVVEVVVVGHPNWRTKKRSVQFLSLIHI